MANENKFHIGFWNYNRAGTKPAEQYVNEWKELGMNTALSSVFDPSVSEPQDLFAELDEAEKRGIAIIVYDYRTHWTSLMRGGEKAFRGGVEAARRDFGKYKAVFGFHIGDEPKKEDIPFVVSAARIVKEIMPDKFLFMNFLPYLGEANFADTVGVSGRDYHTLAAQTVADGSLSVMCYDCYSQCTVINPERGLNMYFKNLNLFAQAAKEAGVPLWTSLLSVGHWHYRVPTEDDLRWQLSTAAAHGVKGIMWYYVYGGDGESSYRSAPVDENGYKTPTFDALARQNRAFMKHYGDRFANAELIKVEHSGISYGGTPAFSSDEFVKSASSLTGTPLIVSRFAVRGGGYAVVVVNLSRDMPTCVTLTLGDKFSVSDEPTEFWLAQGQLKWIDLKD